MTKRSHDATYVEECTTLKRVRRDIYFSKCLLCQKNTEECVVSKPKSHSKLFEILNLRAGYNHLYTDIVHDLQNQTDTSLQEKGASWHRSCYQTLIRKRDIEFERKNTDAFSAKENNEENELNRSFTRSLSSPLDSSACFFCQKEGSRRQPLHKVATDFAGENLLVAVKRSDDDVLQVRLSSAINPKDAHANDVLYHRKCWSVHVSNVLRQTVKIQSERTAPEEAAVIEFLCLIKHLLGPGEILSMADVESTYNSIRKSNVVIEYEISRKGIKSFLIDNIPEMDFSKPNTVIQSERISIKVTRDKALEEAEDKLDDQCGTEMMNNINDCAKILRLLALKSKPWTFSGDITDETLYEHVPSELYCFFAGLFLDRSINYAKTIKR